MATLEQRLAAIEKKLGIEDERRQNEFADQMLKNFNEIIHRLNLIENRLDGSEGRYNGQGAQLNYPQAMTDRAKGY